MIKYRLRFKFQKEDDISINRENNINDIISDIDSISSDTPIRKPLDGELIIISGEEYKVIQTSISFDKDGEVTYYDFLTVLRRNVSNDARKLKDYDFMMDQIMKERLRNEYIEKNRYGKKMM